MTQPKRFRWCLDRRSKCMIQIGRQRPRYVFAENGGEGDCVGVGRMGIATGFNAWLPIAELPAWATTRIKNGERR